MIHIYLSPSQKLELNKRLKTEKNAKIWKRLLALKLQDQNKNYGEIARTLQVTKDTITNWFKLFKLGGFKELTTLNYSGTISKLEPFKDKIKKIIEGESVSKLADLQDRVETKYEVKVEFSWFYRWCKKNFLYPLKRPV